jgi:hypothetical protein
MWVRFLLSKLYPHTCCAGVRTERRKLTCPKEYSNKFLMMTPIRKPKQNVRSDKIGEPKNKPVQNYSGPSGGVLEWY